ncbi:terminase gpA endonuclease subunit [Vibrio harveyi]|uniref:terminase gpA endonuclease subunit n=1 Tax=Vibrio harveyi TaxID=669 RepID=UPI0018C2103F|nr:terminase gpA endonuclease subunit [Vibrio harveyi]
MHSNDYMTAAQAILEAFSALDVDEKSIEDFLNNDLFVGDSSGTIKYRLDDVPYMIKPIKATLSRRVKAVIFVGSARSSKTKSLCEGVTAYRAVYMPTNILIVFATGTKAHSYSKIEYDRMVKSTRPLQKISDRNSHGIEIRTFKNGTVVEFRSATNDALSAQGYGMVMFTDYDRSPDDGTGAGGSEGSKFNRGLKRTLSEGSSGITIAESSPSRIPLLDQENLEEHELLRATGIVAEYNSGSREVWYWQCPDHDHWFKVDIDLLEWDFEKGIEPHIKCPHCSREITFEERANLVGDYMYPHEVDKAGNRQFIFEPPNNDIRSFHCDGLAAAWNKWDDLAKDYQRAKTHYDKTGDESMLQSFINTSIGKPYMPKLRETNLTIATLMEREHEFVDLKKHLVPPDTRFLIATVDVQGGANSRFDVSVIAINAKLQWMPIDKFEILETSYRMDGDRKKRIRPHVYSDDWREIHDQVMSREYLIAGTQKTMIPAVTMCDSGGSADDNGDGNTTFNAYRFWRWCQQNQCGSRFMLIKGNPRAFNEKEHAGWTKVSYPKAENDSENPARGDIPLLNLNSNILKNTVYTSLQTEEAHEDLYFRRPSNDWSDNDWYDSLLSEFVNKYGKWEKHPTKSNENFDHAQYTFAALHHMGVFTEAWSWDNPKPYALPIDAGNINVKDRGKHNVRAKAPTQQRVIRNMGDDAEWH